MLGHFQDRFYLVLAFCLTFQAAAVAQTSEQADAGQVKSSWQIVDSCRFQTSTDTRLKQMSPGSFELSSGDVLIDANKGLAVTTPLSHIAVKRKAVVYIVARKGHERCLVLCDNGLGSVTVICHKHAARLGPGHEAVITDHEPAYPEIMGPEETGRRRIRVHKLDANKAVTTAEVSLLQALERNPLLHRVFHSGQPEDRGLRDRIVKTVAVLNMVTARHGYYSNGRP